MTFVGDIAEQAVQTKLDDLSLWVLERWDAEVKNRPIRNVYRRTLDNTWRQVYRKLTGEELPRPKNRVRYQTSGEGNDFLCKCSACEAWWHYGEDVVPTIKSQEDLHPDGHCKCPLCGAKLVNEEDLKDG